MKISDCIAFNMQIRCMIVFFLLLMLSNVETVNALHLCDDNSLEYIFGPKWVPEIKICFSSEKGILYMDEETPFYFLTIFDQPAKDAKLYLVQESHSGFFKPGSEDYERVLEERKEVGLKEDHIHGISDGIYVFGIDLKEAKHYIINCKKILAPDGETLVDEPGCRYSYDAEENMKFTIPGNYFFAIKMQTNDGEILSDFREISVFEVADYSKQLIIESAQNLEENITPNEIQVESESDSIFENIWFVTIVGGIIVSGLIGLIFYKLIRKKSEEDTKIKLRKQGKLLEDLENVKKNVKPGGKVRFRENKKIMSDDKVETKDTFVAENVKTFTVDAVLVEKKDVESKKSSEDKKSKKEDGKSESSKKSKKVGNQ